MFAITTPALCQQEKASKVLVERVGDTAFIQLHAPSFQALTPRQQALAYWLTQSSIAIDPIIYDQLSAYGLQEKRLLEEIMAHSKGIDPLVLPKIADFAKLFWANRGNHNELTSQKFLPAFTFEQLQGAALSAQHNGALSNPLRRSPAAKDSARSGARTGCTARPAFRCHVRADDDRQESGGREKTRSRPARTLSMWVIQA